MITEEGRDDRQMKTKRTTTLEGLLHQIITFITIIAFTFIPFFINRIQTVSLPTIVVSSQKWIHQRISSWMTVQLQWFSCLCPAVQSHPLLSSRDRFLQGLLFSLPTKSTTMITIQATISSQKTWMQVWKSTKSSLILFMSLPLNVLFSSWLLFQKEVSKLVSLIHHFLFPFPFVSCHDFFDTERRVVHDLLSVCCFICFEIQGMDILSVFEGSSLSFLSSFVSFNTLFLFWWNTRLILSLCRWLIPLVL